MAFDIIRIAVDGFKQATANVTVSEAKLADFCITQQNDVLKAMVIKYQDPTEADKILKVKKDLEETKEILHQSLDKMLERGQSIEKLIEQSESLSDASKDFYKKARQTSCCNIF